MKSGDFIIAQRQRRFLFDCVLWGMSFTWEFWRSMTLILTALVRLSCTIFHDFSLNQYYKWNHILTVLDVWLTHAVLGHHTLSLLRKTGSAHGILYIFIHPNLNLVNISWIFKAVINSLRYLVLVPHRVLEHTNQSYLVGKIASWRASVS